MHRRPNIQQQNHHFLRNDYIISKSTGITKRRNGKPIPCIVEKEVIEMSRKEKKDPFTSYKPDKDKTDKKEQFDIYLHHITCMLSRPVEHEVVNFYTLN